MDSYYNGSGKNVRILGRMWKAEMQETGWRDTAEGLSMQLFFSVTQ